MWRAWVWLDASRLRRSAWCAQQDPGWPLAADSGYADASALCAALAALPATLRLYVHALPRSVASVGVLPLLAPYFNRGYPVEAYLLRNMARGPFTTRDATAANAFLLPMAPYSLRVAAFPGDGLLGVQARVAAAVEAVKASAPAVWAAHGACDHVLVSAHDKGGRVAQTADRALIDHAVLIVNTADTHGDANEWRVAISACQCFTDASACCFADLTRMLSLSVSRGRYTKGKDVAGICSFSTALPGWAGALGACGGPRAAPRDRLVSFVGGGLGAVRQGLFAHFAQQPWPELLVVRRHLAPKEYMRVLLTSKFCLVSTLVPLLFSLFWLSRHTSLHLTHCMPPRSMCVARRCRARASWRFCCLAACRWSWPTRTTSR